MKKEKKKSGYKPVKGFQSANFSSVLTYFISQRKKKYPMIDECKNCYRRKCKQYGGRSHIDFICREQRPRIPIKKSLLKTNKKYMEEFSLQGGE